MNTIEIFTDGSCKKNYGGWGWIATYEQRKLCSDSGKASRTTNQRMELTAVIKALETFSVCDLDLVIFSDSMYVVKGINDKWYKLWEKNGWMTSNGREVKNIDLWERLISLLHKRIKFKHVKAHRESTDHRVVFNNFADKLAGKRK